MYRHFKVTNTDIKKLGWKNLLIMPYCHKILILLTDRGTQNCTIYFIYDEI